MSRRPSEKIPVAVLGATGAVGQMFIRLLADHPWFTLDELAASERSAGKRYVDAARWVGNSAMPDRVRDIVVRNCDPSEISAPIVFSALDAVVAGDVEVAFAKAGRMILSNAKNFRMDEDVPLVIAEVNADHLSLLDRQRVNRGWSGGIITNANCAAIAAIMPLAPLHAAFGIEKLFIATMQAVSGAGYPGVPSLDILGNVIPFISGEEPKIETEIQKMLGHVADGRVRHAAFATSAHANRVAVENGHTVCMSIAFSRRVTPGEALSVMRAWRGHPSSAGLPMSPEFPLIVSDLPDRPQPRRDVESGKGMSVTVGRVREDPLFDIKLVSMAHNTIRGAAGASVQNAELLVATGRLATA